MTKKMNQDKFQKFLENADSLGMTGYCTLGTYDAVAWYDDKPYRCTILALAGDEVRGEVEEITPEKATELVTMGLC